MTIQYSYLYAYLAAKKSRIFVFGRILKITIRYISILYTQRIATSSAEDRATATGHVHIAD